MDRIIVRDKYGSEKEREQILKLLVSKITNTEIDKVVLGDQIINMYSKMDYYNICKPLITILFSEGKNTEAIAFRLKLSHRRVLHFRYK